jgi:hypothetical protein
MMLGKMAQRRGLRSQKTNSTPFIPANLEAAIRSRFVLDASRQSRTRTPARTSFDTDRQPTRNRENGDFNSGRGNARRIARLRGFIPIAPTSKASSCP